MLNHNNNNIGAKLNTIVEWAAKNYNHPIVSLVLHLSLSFSHSCTPSLPSLPSHLQGGDLEGEGELIFICVSYFFFFIKVLIRYLMLYS